MKLNVNTLATGILIASITLTNTVLPIKSFSEQENRFLQKLPKWSIEYFLSGEYSKEFEKFTTDQFTFRDKWIEWKTKVDLIMLKKDNGRVYFGKEGYLFETSEYLDQKRLNANIAALKEFSIRIKELDERINVTALLVPSKNTVLGDLLPEKAPVFDERGLFNNLFEELESYYSLPNLINLFAERSDEYIYYRTDHHWTTDGAYYAYLKAAETLGFEPLERDEFIILSVNESFLGTVYRKANYYSGTPDSIRIYNPIEGLDKNILINNTQVTETFYDESFLDKTDKYSFFMGGDFAIAEINSSSITGKTLLLIKDSYANSLVPFLSIHYDEIIMIDPRYFGGSILEYLADKKIDDVLFTYGLWNFVQSPAISVINK